MSDAEKRQTRQRALTIGACAAVFAFGGQLVSQRFDSQKSQEAYRADAFVLAQAIEAETRGAQLVSFSNKADPDTLVRNIAYTGEGATDEILGALSLRAKDSQSLKGLVAFTFDNLDGAEQEQTQLDCLAEAIYYEARSEDLRGQMAVAEVVMNRVHDSRFPKTVCDVVYQGHYRDTGCQFTFTCDGSLANKPRGDAWDRARAIALNVSLGLAKSVTNKATHYHTDYVNPYWKAGMVETAEIGTHIFYRFPKTSQEWSTARIALAAQHGSEPEEIPGLITVDAETPVAPSIEAPVAASLVAISAKPSDIAQIMPATQVADARPL